MDQHAAKPPVTGRIDSHCHLLPGVDDGCQSIDETLACIALLKSRGFAGSICTPHVWIERYPQNTTEAIIARTVLLQNELRDRGVKYQLWAGGEVRLCKTIIAWMGAHGVPTLGPSRCVLTDIWEPDWPKWATQTLAWLIEQSYQPILAHPERLACVERADEVVRELADMGVWLQGNSACMTGEEGYHADQLIRRWLNEDRYQLLALDTHGPDTLPSRLDGLTMVEMEYGKDKLEQLINRAPRELIFQTSD